MRYGLLILTFFGLINCKGQSAIFKSCREVNFSLDKAEPWQRDSSTSETFIRNCYNSTTCIVLFRDNVYQFKLDGEVNERLSQGIWKIKNDTILLKTDKVATAKFIESHKKFSEWIYREITTDNLVFVRKDNELIEIRKD